MHTVQEGMTLRDWFAGEALVGLVSQEGTHSVRATLACARDAGMTPQRYLAKPAYGAADTMLEARCAK